MIGEIHHHDREHERQAFRGIFRPTKDALHARMELARQSGELRREIAPDVLADLFGGMVFTGVLRRASCASSQLAANQANVAATESSIGSARAQVTAGQARAAVAKSALRDARRQLDYATLTAPAAGRVGNKSVEVGNYVLPGLVGLSIAEENPWIVANFKETQLAHMRPGRPSRSRSTPSPIMCSAARSRAFPRERRPVHTAPAPQRHWQFQQSRPARAGEDRLRSHEPG